MPTLTLDDDEMCALCGLLTDVGILILELADIDCFFSGQGPGSNRQARLGSIAFAACPPRPRRCAAERHV